MEEMAKIEGIPRNDELNITARANALFVKWGNVGNKAEEPKTNGAEPEAKRDSSKEKTEEKAEEKPAEEKPAEEKTEAPAAEAAAETTEAAA